MKFFVFLCFFVHLAAQEATPVWIGELLDSNFSYFASHPFRPNQLDEHYRKKGRWHQLVKVKIEACRVEIDQQYIDRSNQGSRIENYKNALDSLCRTRGLPDVSFLLSVNDAAVSGDGFPVFGMCKPQDAADVILIPDYEAIAGRYQVLEKGDIVADEFVWEEKIPQLIWRGSTAQLWTRLSEKHIPYLSRVALCELSQAYPHWIDAKFTIYAQGGENMPSLQHFKGSKMGFEEQLGFKYHILIDGNVSPYSASAWKLFGNSLIFKPDSPWVQWYFPLFKPDVHYAAVKGDLSDLLQKLNWYQQHDDSAKEIAANCRRFAIDRLTVPDNLDFLYWAIIKYAKLVEEHSL